MRNTNKTGFFFISMTEYLLSVASLCESVLKIRLRQSQNYEFIFNLQKKREKKASTGNYASWGRALRRRLQNE